MKSGLRFCPENRKDGFHEGAIKYLYLRYQQIAVGLSLNNKIHFHGSAFEGYGKRSGQICSHSFEKIALVVDEDSARSGKKSSVWITLSWVL
jgi:hypothetical protein